MKNLKKVLALVLAFACAFTMFAGAAFTDKADIKADEAVDTLVALGVIKGYEDGSFRPDATVTRAEMAKMIYVLRTGKDDASAYAATTTTFKDINNHWAAGYIKYCQSLGIIAGKSATIFDPDKTVTGTEAAKMLLVTLGYNAERAGLVGKTWDKTTIALADENGLLEDVDAPLTLALPRQYAAQLIFNAIDAPTVKLDDGVYTNSNVLGQDNQTIGEKYMSLKKTTGTLVSVTKTNGKDTFEMKLDNIDLSESTYQGDNKGLNVTSFTDVDKDYSSMKYKTVKVLYKDKKTVYGVYETKDNTIQTGILKDMKMDGGKVKLDGVKYDLADKTTVYVNGVYQKGMDIVGFVNKYGDGASNKYTDTKFMQPTAVKLMATDGTNNYSVLEVTTYAVGKITSVGSDYVNVSFKKGDNTIVSSKCEDDDWNYYSGIAKNDYVVMTAAGNYADDKGVIEKATVVSGKVTGTQGDDKVAIDGQWYTMAGKGKALVKAPNLNSKVEMVVVNDFVYFTDTQSGSVEDVALLVEVANANGVGSKKEARMIFADGSDKVVSIEKFWEDSDNKAKPIDNFAEGNNAILVSYEVSKDVYTLTKVGEEHTFDNTDYETAGYDAYITAKGGKTDGSIKEATVTATGDDGKTISNVSRLYYDSAATVFVKYNADSKGQDASYKVVTGKVASGYNKSIEGAAALADKSGNSYYGKAVFLDMSNSKSTGGSSDKTYAVALSKVSKQSVSGSTVYTVTGWNGTEEITFNSEDSFSMNKGDIFEYSEAGEDLYDIDPVDTDANYYVSAYDSGSGDIELRDTNHQVVKDADGKNKTSIDSRDTVVLYVNSDKGVGVSSAFDIELAYYYDSDFWTDGEIGKGELTEDNAPNVRAYFDDDDYITVIVVDENRNITQW